MAIDTNGSTSTTQYVSFPVESSVIGMTNETICAWIYIDALGDANLVGGPNAPIRVFVGDSAFGVTNALFIMVYFEGPQNDMWGTPTDSLTTGAWHHIAVSYNKGGAGTAPVMYIDGVSKTVTRLVSSSSSVYAAAAENKVYVGGFDGKTQDFRIYNRILTAAEVLMIYNSRGTFYTPSGLVFLSFLDAATGVSTFEGTALSGSQTILDVVGRGLGVPVNSPVGRCYVTQSYMAGANRRGQDMNISD